jgi:hypothetical protein
MLSPDIPQKERRRQRNVEGDYTQIQVAPWNFRLIACFNSYFGHRFMDSEPVLLVGTAHSGLSAVAGLK